MSFAFARLRRLLRRLFYALLFAGLIVAWAVMDGRVGRGRAITDAAGERVMVADGDTLRIGNRTIRLAGIDAVEYRQFCTAADGSQWSCGTRAREALEALVAQGGLACTPVATDRYQRAVAICRTRETPDLGAAMVKAGWAINEDDRDTGQYALEEVSAAAARRGIWVGAFQEPPLWRAAQKAERPAS